MERKPTTQHLQDQWDLAVQRATEEKPRSEELGNARFSEAAGLHIEAGIKAGGLWGATNGCSASATCPCSAGC